MYTRKLSHVVDLSTSTSRTSLPPPPHPPSPLPPLAKRLEPLPLLSSPATSKHPTPEHLDCSPLHPHSPQTEQSINSTPNPSTLNLKPEATAARVAVVLCVRIKPTLLRDGGSCCPRLGLASLLAPCRAACGLGAQSSGPRTGIT